MSLLTISSLSISSLDRKIVDQISFSLGKGEIVGLMGPSGSGKSTLAYSLVQMNPPSFTVSGSVTYKDKNLLALPEKKIREIRGQHIGFLQQDPFSSLHPAMRVKKQILESPISHGLDKKNTDIWISELVQFLQIDHLLDRYSYQLSGGQRQRVCLAMALSCKPSILIADEPTTALDEALHKEVLSLLSSLRERYALSIFFISHEKKSVEFLCDRYLILEKGKIINQIDKSYEANIGSKKSFQKV